MPASDPAQQARERPDDLAERARRKVASAVAGLRVAEEDVRALARELYTMRMRQPVPERAAPDACPECGLHPHDFSAGEYEDELRRIEGQRDDLAARLLAAEGALAMVRRMARYGVGVDSPQQVLDTIGTYIERRAAGWADTDTGGRDVNGHKQQPYRELLAAIAWPVWFLAGKLPLCRLRLHDWCDCCSPMYCVRCGRKDWWS